MTILRFLMTSTFYPPFHIGGDANHVKYLSEELLRLGHEVHVFCSMDAYKLKEQQASKVIESQEGVITHRYNSILNLSPYFAYFFGNSLPVKRTFKNLVKQIKPQIVHHHNISLLGYGILDKCDSYANVYTAHDYWLICPQNNLLRNGVRECNVNRCASCSLRHWKPPQLWRYLSDFKKSVDNIDLIIAPSNYLNQRLSNEIGINSVVIHNFAPRPPLQIPDQEFSDYYLFVGALEEHKGIMNLLEVFKRGHSKIDAKLLIVGKGKLETKIKNFVENYSLTKSVIYVGAAYKEKLYSLYQGAKALIVPSICPENFPLVALEAISVGTPVIASDKGGLPEIVEKVDRKLIFRDFFELENLLSGFCRKTSESNRIKDIYAKNFSPEAFTEKYMKIILSLTD